MKMPATEVLDWARHQTWPDVRHILSFGVDACFLHPYGFVASRTAWRELPGWQVRVHFWSSEDYAPQTLADEFLIHSHGWDLVSKVVVGALEEVSYSVSNSQSGPWRVFNVDNTASGVASYLLRSGRSVSLEPPQSVVRDCSSEPFRIGSDSFHSTYALTEEFSVSVVATELASPTRSLVLSQTDVSAVSFAREEVDCLDELIDRADLKYSTASEGEDSWAAFAFVLDSDGQIAMARTKRMPMYWAPIGGRRKLGDQEPLDTVTRELFEELGLEATDRDLKYVGSFDRDIGIGVTHFWVVEISSRVGLQPDMQEFAEFMWVRPDSLPLLRTYAGVKSAWSRIGNA